MAKPSAYLMRQRAMQDAREQAHERWSMGMAQDAMLIAVRDVFHIGHDRIIPLLTRFNEALQELSGTINKNSRNRDELEYAKHKIDEAMRDIYGEWMPELDVRWGLKPPTKEKIIVDEKQRAYMEKYLAATGRKNDE